MILPNTGRNLKYRVNMIMQIMGYHKRKQTENYVGPQYVTPISAKIMSKMIHKPPGPKIMSKMVHKPPYLDQRTYEEKNFSVQ
jgi:hypothetical protein